MNDLRISYSKEEIKDIILKPLKVAQTDETDNDDNDEDYDSSSLEDNTPCIGEVEAMELGNGDFKTDIAAMKQFEMIKKGDCGKIQEKFKCIEKLTIAMYSKFECNQLQPQTKKIIPFVEINYN